MRGYRWWVLQTPRQALLGGLTISVLIGLTAQWFYFMPWRAELDAQPDARAHALAPQASVINPPAAAVFLLPAMALARWLSEVVLLAQDLTLTVTAIQPQPPQLEATWTRQWVDVELFGSYQHMGAFLQRLETLTPRVRINALQAKAQPDGVVLLVQLELWLSAAAAP